MLYVINTLPLSELNVLVVLIKCSLAVIGGDQLSDLYQHPNADIYIQDLVKHDWSESEAFIIICSLKDKGFIDVSHDKIYLTDQWRQVEPIWHSVEGFDRKFELGERKTTYIF